MAREVLGHIPCPMHEGFEMDVKRDKNGNPYAFCPDCCTQILTHGREPRASLMLKRMRPAAPAVAEEPPVAPEPEKGLAGAIAQGEEVTTIGGDGAPVKVKRDEPKTKPKPRGGFEGLL